MICGLMPRGRPSPGLIRDCRWKRQQRGTRETNAHEEAEEEEDEEELDGDAEDRWMDGWLGQFLVGQLNEC